MLKKTLILCMVMTIGASAALSQGKETKSVTLSKMKPCMVLTGSVQPKHFDTYVFRARKGQTIVANPYFYGKETHRPKDDAQGLSGFVIIQPNGQKFEDPQDIQFAAEQTGRYKVLVRPAYKRATGKYALKISVTDRPPADIDDTNKAPTCR
jgi:hypothetical protein